MKLTDFKVLAERPRCLPGQDWQSMGWISQPPFRKHLPV